MTVLHPNIGLVMILVQILILLATSANGGSYESTGTKMPYYPPSYAQSSYLPAPPGKRPSCAGPTDTYCTSVDYYPTEMIEYLIKRYSFDFKTLLQDETMDSMLAMASSAPPPSILSSASTVSQVYIPNSETSYNTTSSSSWYNEPAVKPPYVGPYSNTNGSRQDWFTRYSGRSSEKQNGRHHQSVSTSYRVSRQVPNDETLCPTTSSFITPRAAVNTRGNWMYVVNLDQGESTTQLVRTERCATTACSGLCTVPVGFSSTCSQQFVQKRLVALNGNGENLYTDTFWFPHCCICQIRASTS